MNSVFDWQTLEDQLVGRSRQALLQFATEYPEVTCSFFAYDVHPYAGDFLLSFESIEHSLKQAQEQEQWAIARRSEMLSREWSWRAAKYFSTAELVTDYNAEVEYFAYHLYADLHVEELNQLSASEEYPQGGETENNYIEGNIRIVLWKVIERLIASDSFSPLTLASPFRAGYQYFGEELIVLRILNWPHL